MVMVWQDRVGFDFLLWISDGVDFDFRVDYDRV